MGRSDVSADRVESLRQWLFWVLVLGLAGTETELLLLEHYEDPWQFVPLVLIACAIGVLGPQARRPQVGKLPCIAILIVFVVVGGFHRSPPAFPGWGGFPAGARSAIGTW